MDRQTGFGLPQKMVLDTWIFQPVKLHFSAITQWESRLHGSDAITG
jgi:hypothetical protein